MIFYPTLLRRSNYSRNAYGSWHSSYSAYRDEIAEDCQSRCVYCDILLHEHGGEGLQIDHFKPSSQFPALVSDPHNLVLACPKCNRLKSDHWPVDTSIGVNGFIDPFTNDRYRYFSVLPCGTIDLSSAAPVIAIQVRLLQLNRPARVQARRLRQLNENIDLLSEKLEIVLQRLCDTVSNSNYSKDHVRDEVFELSRIYRLLNDLRNIR